MIKPRILVRIAVVCVISGLAAACGSQIKPVAQACGAQENKNDCIATGNTILALSDVGAGYECVWKDGRCIGQAK